MLSLYIDRETHDHGPHGTKCVLFAKKLTGDFIVIEGLGNMRV